MEQRFIEDNLLVFSKQTADLFFKQNKPESVLALYFFYYYTAKWQKTNQPKATTRYAATGLHWGLDKTKQYKKLLIKLGLIEDVVERDPKTKKIKGWYIRVHYIWKPDTLKTTHPLEKPAAGFIPPVEKPATNALSVSSRNALSTNSEMLKRKPAKAGEVAPHGNQEVNEILAALKATFDLKVLDGSERENRRYAWLALGKFKGKGNVLGIIHLAAADAFWQDKVASMKPIYYNGVAILSKQRSMSKPLTTEKF